jgi:hypothetical protein
VHQDPMFPESSMENTSALGQFCEALEGFCKTRSGLGAADSMGYVRSPPSRSREARPDPPSQAARTRAQRTGQNMKTRSSRSSSSLRSSSSMR